MATLSTFQKFKEEQEKKKQGGQQSYQQSTQQSGQKSTGLMNSYQQFMAKQQGQETTYTPESDYGQRVMDVIGKVGNSAASRNGEWTADASGGNAAEINALLREYDAYTGDKSGMTEYRNALLDYNKRIQAENQYYAGFGTKDDFNRVRSGYTNFGVGYDPQSYGLDDASARKLRQESAQNDAKEAQRALAELNSARKNFAAVDSEWRAMDERYRSFTIDEYDKDLTQRWQAAKDQVTAAENALLNARNRMDAYNATWGKVDKYGETSEAAKGTDTSYTGPGYESIADWENKKNEELAAQDAQAQRPDYVPGALRYTSDTEPVAEDRLGLWRSLTPEQKQDAVNSSNVQLNNVVMAGNDGYWDLLTDNEVETYYYIKGKQGQEAANQYLDDMYIELSRRNELKTVQSIENANSWEKAGLTAVSVGANLVGAIPAALGKTADMVTGRTNPYSSMQFFQRYASYIRGSVGQDIGDWTESKLADKFGEQFAAKAGNLANQTFQALMSGVDSMAGAMTFGQGLALPAGPFNFHVGGYTTVMGMGAFAQRAQELELKGATPTQIAIGSIGSGILEALFEDVSMEVFFTNILDNPAKTAGEFVKKLAIQMGVEGSEEMFTEMGNIILDAINMGKNSENSMAVREYMAQGMTEEKARQQVWKDNAVDILWAGYGGAISAGAMAAGGQALSSGVNRVHSTVGNYAVGSQLLENGRAVDLQEQAESLTNEKKRAKLQKAAADVANKASAGDKSFRNTYRTGKVATQIAQQAGREARSAETAEFRKAAEKYLEGQRGIQNKKLALNVLTRAYDGTAMLPGDKAYMRMIGGEKLTQEILNSVGGKETLQENAKPSVEASMRTIGNVQSSVLGIAPETKAEFDSDNSGQAFQKSDSEPINILASEPIAKVENGILYLNTDDGQEIAASDVSYGNSGEAAVYAAISNMQTDTETARSLLSGIDDSGLSSSAYARAIQNAYYRGMNGVKFEDTPGYSDAAKLPETQRRAAWEAGKQRRAAKVREQSALIDSGKAGTRESGVTMQESAKSIRSLNKQQQTGMAAAKALAAAGLHVEVYASTEAERKAGKPNGVYRKADGSIAIDLNAGDNGQGAVAYALAHETTHFIQDYSPDKFETYAELIIAAAESKGISYDSLLARQLARLSEMEEYKNLSETELQDIAYDETIAEMSETILTDTDAANRLSQQIYKQDRTLWQKIKDFFTGLVEKLRNAYRDSDPDSDIGRMLKRAVQDNAEIAQAWAEAVRDAGENYQLQDGESVNAGTVMGSDGNSVEYLHSERVTDKDTLDFLNSQDTVTTYKTMQLVDGKLYPPMAAIVAGSYEDYSELGKWEAATEHPELIKLDKSGKPKFTLNKGKGQGNIAAAYNPYMHSSNLVLNDQFSGAYTRPNLVTVECEVPKSELTSGYKAQYAKDSVGWHSWHTGTVAGALRQQTGTERQVFLSRWIKPVRIIPNSEVARMYSELLSGTDIAVPDNVVPPALLAELKKAGVKISESGRLDGQKNNAREGERFSSRSSATQYDYSKSFEEQVADYKKGLIPKGDTLLVGKTPDVFLGIGMNALPVTINTTHIDYALNGTKDFDHHLGEALLNQLPEAIKKPIAIMTSGTKNGSSVVAMLEVRHNGKQVIMPVAIDGFGKQNGIVIDSNAITSIYGKNNSISRVLSDAIAQENDGQFRLFYLNENKAAALLQEARVPMPKNPVTHNGGFIHSITDSNSPVKQKIGNVTKSQQFKRWFGDWQNDPANASKVVNEDGTPKVLYHQTSADFTIFEPRHEGAGTRDQDTPFGIFMKSSDRNIGVKGEKQMALYARIVNPLRVTDRADLMYQLKRISPEYEKVSAELRSLNDAYQQKHEDAKKAFADYIVKWRQENPNASRTAIYDDAGFNEVYDAEDNVLDEWETEARKVELRSKEAITRDLEKQGYDGVIIRTDKGSFGRSTDAYIALRPEQVKSATDNIGTFDKANPDIRYSSRNARDSVGDLQAELYQLKEQRKKLLEDYPAYRAAVEQRRYANTFTERVSASKALKAAESNVDTSAIDSRITELQDRITEIRESKIRQHREEQEKYSGTKTGGYSLEPDTRLKDLDVDYSEAVKSGDRRKMQALVYRAAEAAMPKSVVRDESGKLLKVYHYTNNDFTVFDRGMVRTGNEMDGFFFAPDTESTREYGERRIAAYLNITNLALDPVLDREFNDSGTLLREKLAAQGYDGVARTENGKIYEYMVFDSNQVKYADAVTYDDNGNVVPLSQRFDTGNEDIRYSSRNSGESRVDKLVRKNEELKAEAEYLKQVVQIQKQGNRMNLRNRESVNDIAKGILESVNAKDGEFGKKLNDFYRDLVTVEMDYDTMQEKAGELADRALEHHQAERDGYAQEVLDFLKKRRVSLTESQIGDAEYTYGSLSEFKKAIRGSIILDQNSTTSLDQLWQEAAARFPDRFGADTTEADMPDGIANIVSWANSAEADSETEFQYYKAETKADLTRKILMGFLDAKPIESVSDTLKQQLADLKQQHKQEMQELRKSWDEEAKAMERSHRYDLEAERKRGKAAVEALKYQQEVIQKAQEGLWESERADIKRSYEKQMKELKEQNTQKAHEKVESRHRTEERHKLQNTIDTLNRMLLRPTNTTHVPQELQSSVAMAMKVINGVILDSKTGQNADRLAKYAEQLRKLEGNPEDNAEKIADLNRKIGDLTGRDISMKAALTSLQEQYAKLEGQDGGLYDENIEALIEDAKETIGNTAYKDLSLKQLKAVRDTYTALLTTIRNANKAFVAGKNARIDEMVKRATTELSLMKKKNPNQTAMGRMVDQFFWNNEKPVYAFERIGSAVMSELYDNLRKGEDTFYRDVSQARDFFLESAEKNGFSKWDLNELKEFTAADGRKFQLSLDELMSLYAYSLRPQAREHLTRGGIVLGENTKRFTKGPLGVTRETTYNDANAYTLTDETIDAIVNSLTKEQRQFAFEMQQYLAKVMGAKGDEVNMAMYGIKKFGEETYWPLKSSGVFSERIREQQERTGNKVKNSGFTKALTQHANNAIELSSLTETWAQHVNDMSMYHAFTLPMEDFYRVYNWTQKGDSKGKQTMGVRQMIQQTAGKGAVTYIDQFLKDLNGGLRADPRETVSKAMLSGFKKAAVSASLSVAIQQPSSVGRALAYIEPKYFIGSKVEGAKFAETWKQLKKYAAVAGLKEMGRFDVDMGRSTLEYIIGRNGLSTWGKITDKVDKFSGWLPEMADQVTWCAIWEAAKRKTAAQNPGLHGEALLQKAGELFTDTITRTQVYDSVFSRSANMRAKSGLMSMATAFMAEPTTTANMVEDAVRKFSRGDKRMAGKFMSSVAVATVLNAALASVVYAARDDDDDKTYWEKYMASIAGETVDSFNPLTYIPVLSDINNLLLGYSIERTDMSLASDLITALKKITTLYGKYDDEWSDEEKKEWKKKVRDAWLDNAWMVGTVMGLPLKNVVRDVEAVFNTARNPSNGADMSADTVLKAVKDSARKNFPILSWKADESSSDQLYKAITQGKDVLARRLKAQFGDEKKYESALLKGLRENDPRIKTAAQYAIDGNTPKRVAIIREIVAEGHYTQDQVIKAINQKANSMKEKTQSGKESPPEKLYDYSEYVNAAANGLGYAGDVREEMISYQADRNQENDGKLTRAEAEEAAENTFKSNVKSDAKDGYAVGELTEAQVRKVLTAADIAEDEELDDLILQWDTELELGREIDWGDTKYLEYADDIRPAGISVDVYDEWLRQVKYHLTGVDEDGDGKADRNSAVKQKAAYINSLPLTAEQKEALWRTVSTSARTLRKYRLW